jgi:hypothetical protein
MSEPVRFLLLCEAAIGQPSKVSHHTAGTASDPTFHPRQAHAQAAGQVDLVTAMPVNCARALSQSIAQKHC